MSYRKYITPNGVINTEADCLAGRIQRPTALDYDPADFERGQHFTLTEIGCTSETGLLLRMNIPPCSAPDTPPKNIKIVLVDKMDKLTEQAEEMLTGWDIDQKYKYLCFYHKAFPFMNDSWGFDCSDTKEELLEQQYPLFSPKDIFEQASFDQTFRLVLNAIAGDPQLLLCPDGEYRMCRCCLNSRWGWVCVPARFTKDLWKKLSSQYRSARFDGYRMHRHNMLALDDAQFKIAQRLICEVFDDEIGTHENQGEI